MIAHDVRICERLVLHNLIAYICTGYGSFTALEQVFACLICMDEMNSHRSDS